MLSHLKAHARCLATGAALGGDDAVGLQLLAGVALEIKFGVGQHAAYWSMLMRFSYQHREGIEGFEGGLSVGNYRTITGASPATHSCAGHPRQCQQDNDRWHHIQLGPAPAIRIDAQRPPFSIVAPRIFPGPGCCTKAMTRKFERSMPGLSFI